jgi:YHS domain-containing protein
MFRAALELLFTILIVIIARAVLTSVMKGITNAAANASSSNAHSASQPNRGPAAQPSGELHKDPVCGTYVAESTAFRRQAAGQSFYYCSEACREKHSLVAR